MIQSPFKITFEYKLISRNEKVYDVIFSGPQKNQNKKGSQSFQMGPGTKFETTKFEFLFSYKARMTTKFELIFELRTYRW
jgi:hypothetical protein